MPTNMVREECRSKERKKKEILRPPGLRSMSSDVGGKQQ